MGGHHRLASGGRARAAAIYPFQLCKAILRGFRNQLRSDGRMIQGICGLQSLEWEEARTLQWDELPEASAESLESALTRCSPKRPPELSAGRRRRPTTEAPATEELQSMSADGRAEMRRQEVCAVDMKNRRCHENFRDATNGQALNPALVREARNKKLEYFESKGVWHKRQRSEAYKFTGKPPISVKWVDVNKGDHEFPNYRSR